MPRSRAEAPLPGDQPFLVGERIVMRPLMTDDAPLVARWMNDERVTYFMFTGQRPLTAAQLSESIALDAKAGNPVFMVEDRETSRPVGSAGLYDLHPTARKGEFRVLLGEKDVWNRGYGTEVTEMLTWYGFDRLNLNKVWLGVIVENRGAHRAYVKAGFREEGRLREELYRNSRYYDSIRMSILRSEYYPDLHGAHAKRFSVTVR